MTLKGTNGTNGIDCHWLIALLQSGCLDHAILLFANGPKCEPTNASSTTCYSVNTSNLRLLLLLRVQRPRRIWLASYSMMRRLAPLILRRLALAPPRNVLPTLLKTMATSVRSLPCDSKALTVLLQRLCANAARVHPSLSTLAVGRLPVV